MEPAVNPRTIESYRQSCLDICAARLGRFKSLADIAAAEDEINAYPRLQTLADPRGVVGLDAEALTPAQMDRAAETILSGRFFAEHAAAGEATRLKLGTKYTINPKLRLSLHSCAQALADELGREVTPAEVLEKCQGVRPEELLDLSLGARHMLQMTFDLTRLAQARNRNPRTVLESQTTLLVLNEASAEEVLAELIRAKFFGFNPDKFWIMVQLSFEGINLRDGRFFFDPALARRLHNHGQMAMQQTAENQVFRLDPRTGERLFLTPEEVTGVLERMNDKLSYNIEDLSYLTGALDLPALALALSLSDQGARMVMEIVANNPDKPQKGGLAAWDEVLGRNVMIESFQLLGLPNERIKFLNRNFNHYPKPAAAFQALANGLPMPVTVKGEGLYFQPIQGDLNFLVPTAFVRRKVLAPISAWKSAATTPAAIAAMAAQDRQDGFKDFAQDILQTRL